MKYSYDDFAVLKDKMMALCCGAGKFGKDIYAVKIYNEVGNQFWYDIFEITEKEFSEYPNNAWELSRRFKNSYDVFLCSNYNGKNSEGYSFDIEEDIVLDV